MKPVEHYTDEQLVKLARSNAEAFGVFYDRHHFKVLAALRGKLPNAELALDVTAETFAAALESSNRFEDRGTGSALAWLFGIARFKLLDVYRKGGAEDRVRRQLSMNPLTLAPTELEQLEHRLEAGNTGVLAALLDLPENERDAIQARIVEENDYPAIADRLRVSESVVRQRVSRGLRRLRTTLTETQS